MLQSKKWGGDFLIQRTKISDRSSGFKFYWIQYSKDMAWTLSFHISWFCFSLSWLHCWSGLSLWWQVGSPTATGLHLCSSAIPAEKSHHWVSLNSFQSLSLPWMNNCDQSNIKLWRGWSMGRPHRNRNFWGEERRKGFQGKIKGLFQQREWMFVKQQESRPSTGTSQLKIQKPVQTRRKLRIPSGSLP